MFSCKQNIPNVYDVIANHTNQEPLTIYRHLGTLTPSPFYWIRVAYLFSFLCCIFFFSYLRSVSGAQCRLFPCPLFITLSVFLHVYIPLEYEIRMVVVILSYVVDNSRLLGSPTTLQNLLSVSFVYFC